MAHRLDRLAGRRGSVDLERTIRDLAVEYGLDPAEVRAELPVIEEHGRRYGPRTLEQAVRRFADELGLPGGEVWADVARITDGGR